MDANTAGLYVAGYLNDIPINYNDIPMVLVHKCIDLNIALIQDYML